MQTTFLSPAGVVLFTRDDMEQGNWVQEEYTVNATFPFDEGKVILRGQRIAFRDPATNSLEIFEVRNVSNTEPDHFQQIIAEHIAVAELSDDHINTQEITGKTPAQALATVLTGTLWSVGNVAVTNTSDVDIARGSVWQAVNAIANNWNVYIVPRVTTNAAGTITGRYLDVTDAKGVWRGLRLSIHKNMSDSAVVYDDTEVLTALYGYGGNIDKAQQSGDDKKEVLSFADIVWTATADHPAKPSGQTYIEDPEKTTLYGRNGRARFGFYQNGDIKDPAVLLQKTWEALQETSTPKISITGTVTDLYRLGYKDEPIRLHDIAIVDIPETGEVVQLQIIKNDVDLLDPTETRPEIGSYIANIIYINREENKKGGGGGGGRGQKEDDYKEANTFSALEKTNDMIGMVVGTRNGDSYIKAGEIVLAINESGTTARISADKIELDGETIATLLASYSITCVSLDASEGSISGGSIFGNTISATSQIYTDGEGSFGSLYVDGSEILVSDASVSGDTLTITKTDGSTINFKKVIAPVLSGSWSSGVLTVTSDPIPFSNLYYFLSKGEVTWSGATGTVPILASPDQHVSGSVVANYTVNAPFAKVNHPTTGLATFNMYAYSGGQYISMGSHSWYYHT